MGQRFNPSRTSEINALSRAHNDDDAAAVYPDHDVITRHFDGPLTIGDFVSAFADGAEGHGGLPTYLRITLQSDATKLRRLMTETPKRARGSKRVTH